MKSLFNQIYAITKRELKIQWRFRYSYLFSLIVAPMISFIPLLIMYGGFFFFISENLGSVNPQNYGTWILLGVIFASFCGRAFGQYEAIFVREKLFRTIEFTLLAPINRFSFLLGIIFQIILEQSIISIFLASIGYILYPTFIPNILLIFMVLFFTACGVGGWGIFRGAVALTSENFIQFFQLFSFILIFFSCYSIPIELFPPIFHPLIRINPFYIGMTLIRDIWFFKFSLTSWEIIYFVIFNVGSIMIGIFLFDRIWKHFGVHGF